jgi:aminopeptidase
MQDVRYQKLANLLVRYSLRLKRDERVLLDFTDTPDAFAVALIRAVRSVGACPLVEVRHSRIGREVIRAISKEQARLQRDLELARMKKVVAYVAIRGAHNSNESSDIEPEQLALYSRIMRPVLDRRVNQTRWVVLRWPTPSMAQAAGMSTEKFEDFFFDVCTMDYARMSKAMKPLQRLMAQTDQVHLTGPGTDLTFSIKGIGAVCCEGSRNIPDGEVFSCPIKESVEGAISFNAPSVYQGSRFENIKLKFLHGKIIEASSSDTKKLNAILDTDPGARYIGEFSLGFNPYILNPMGDILFDEKIAGSLHFTPGQAYEEADNGNRSAVHWDMVLIQRPDWGGGSVYFDGKLIRKNGKFVHPELKGLNPERLIARKPKS